MPAWNGLSGGWRTRRSTGPHSYVSHIVFESRKGEDPSVYRAWATKDPGHERPARRLGLLLLNAETPSPLQLLPVYFCFPCPSRTRRRHASHSFLPFEIGQPWLPKQGRTAGKLGFLRILSVAEAYHEDAFKRSRDSHASTSYNITYRHRVIGYACAQVQYNERKSSRMKEHCGSIVRIGFWFRCVRLRRPW